MVTAFSHPWMLVALAGLPLLGLLSWRARRGRRRGLVELAGPVLARQLAKLRPGRWRQAAVFAGLACLAIGMAGPRWGRDWSQSAAPGRDVVVLVDLSRSMFAGAPTRVDLARMSLRDLCDTLEKRGGMRVALVGFAGRAELLCPLTHDLEHFRAVVEEIDAQVHDATLGAGTRIGAALAFAGGVFDGRSAAARDVLLLSDGDDPARDGEFRLGIEALRGEGVTVHVVGFGDRDTPQRIPDGRGWLSYRDEEVRTRLEEAPLREIARRSGGQLWLAGTRPLPLGELYAAVAARQTDEDSPDAVPVLRQRQEWFLLPAFVLLLLSMALPPARLPRRSSSAPVTEIPA